MKQSDDAGSGTDRRTILKGALRLAGGGALASLVPFQRGATAQTPSPAAAAAAIAGSQLILLGTQGGPNINLQRGEAASVIVTGGVPYLIDCGYGTLRALVQAGLRLNDVENVFVTHLHNDHTADIAAMLSHKWTGNQSKVTTVHGPHGTNAMVDGAIAFFRGNTEIRIVDEGRAVKPEALFRGHDVSAGQITEVFKDERVTVRAVENTHFPDRATARMPYRSVAYRFTMPDRSIVFSGDTAYSTGLIALAMDADVLVCEAIDLAMRATLLEEAKAEPGGLAVESVPRHVVETHTTTEEAGKMAAEARVKTLVLNHLLPGSNPQRGGPIPDARYIESAAKYFKGRIIVGTDQMRI